MNCNQLRANLQTLHCFSKWTSHQLQTKLWAIEPRNGAEQGFWCCIGTVNWLRLCPKQTGNVRSAPQSNCHSKSAQPCPAEQPTPSSWNFHGTFLFGPAATFYLKWILISQGSALSNFIVFYSSSCQAHPTPISQIYASNTEIPTL